jgi:uncharacterized membrane protein
MTLQPLLAASWPIQLHVATLVLCGGLGTWLFFASEKGSPMHRAAGRTFLALMVLTALDTLLIHVRTPHAFLGLSVLHLYVPLILLLATLALYGAATHRIRLHRFAVIALYFGSLVFTGLVQIFAAPGITHQIFFTR